MVCFTITFYTEWFETANRNTHRPITMLSFSQSKSAHLWHCIKLAIHFTRLRAMSIPCEMRLVQKSQVFFSHIWKFGLLGSLASSQLADDVVRVSYGKLIEGVLPTLLQCSGDVSTLMFLAGRLANVPLDSGTKPDLVMRCPACIIAQSTTLTRHKTLGLWHLRHGLGTEA